MSMRQLFVIGNWKMNPESAAAAVRLFTETVAVVRTIRGVQAVACPPALYLSECRRRYRGKSLLLGAQDLSAHAAGAHTGEISGAMLKSMGAAYVIIGHSERRTAGESDDLIAAKVKAALGEGLTVVLCVGERERDDHGDYLHVLRSQVARALAGTPAASLDRIIIAYEPVWAIGKTAKDAMQPEMMHETGLYLRKILSQLYNPSVAAGISILYGGSVEPENAEVLFERGEVDGFLVGHASLSASSLGTIIKAVQAVTKRRAELREPIAK